MNDRRLQSNGRRLIAGAGLIALTMAWGPASMQANDVDVGVRSMDVVLITISSLRADHVSCQGYERQTTPHFDRFAAESVFFRNAFATSGWMMPAHGSLFTSLYPSLHGATHIDRELGQEHETLAELLADNGYYCVGFCCGPRLDSAHGYAQGFHVYDDQSAVGLLRALELDRAESFDINRHRTNDLINDAVISWLQSNAHHPFFLFVHYYDNHWDYLPPEPYRSRYDPNYTGTIDGTRIAREPLYSNPPSEADIRHLIALYDGEVRQTDEDLGDLLAALKREGLFESSLVIILGDHGEAFYEHGHTSHHGVYDELIHIPLAISIPRVASNALDALVSQVDILPTVLDYAGIGIGDQCQGRSLRPIIEGRVQRVNEFVVAQYTGKAVPDIFAVRSPQFKCCMTAQREVLAYDLVSDPQETVAIGAQQFTAPMRQLEEILLPMVSP